MRMGTEMAGDGAREHLNNHDPGDSVDGCLPGSPYMQLLLNKGA
jgi:hypothetical protein